MNDKSPNKSPNDLEDWINPLILTPEEVEFIIEYQLADDYVQEEEITEEDINE